jgi:hypothetical protein
MDVHTVVAQLCMEDLIPTAVLERVTDRPCFLRDLARHVKMNDEDLYHTTGTYLRNLGRLDESAGPDADLRLVLVPELWERLRPDSRDALRGITSNLAEYRGNQPTIFWRGLSPETRARLRTSADNLRARMAAARDLDVRSLVEQTRLALVGSRAGNAWPSDYPVYEPGFTYRLVPTIAWRALLRGRCELET